MVCIRDHAEEGSVQLHERFRLQPMYEALVLTYLDYQPARRTALAAVSNHVYRQGVVVVVVIVSLDSSTMTVTCLFEVWGI